MIRGFLIAFALLIVVYLSAQNLKSDINRARELTDNNNVDEAIELLFDVIERANAVQNDSIIGRAHIRLGTAFYKSDKIDIALNHYQRANNIGLSTKDSFLMAQSHFGIALAYQESHQYDSAIKYYDHSIVAYSEFNDSTTLSYLYSNLSNMYSQMGSLNEMALYSKRALDIQLKNSDLHGSAVSYSNLALHAYNNMSYNEAIRFYKKSASDYKRVDDQLRYSETLNSIGINFFKAGNRDSSALYFFIADSIGHDLFHQDYQDKILELETKYQTAKLERDNALKEAELEESGKQLSILVFTILVFTAFAGVGYYLIDHRRKRTKAISNQQIQDLLQQQEMQTTYALLEGQDKERKRIASELHDNLGSILVTLNMYADSLLTKSKPAEIKDISNRISVTSKKANDSVRQISHSLDSGLLKHFGLKVAMTQLLEAVEMAKKIKVNKELNLDDHISNEIGLEIYRIIQELVNNSLKHANCSSIRLEANQIKENMNIIYEDNGIGFDQKEISRGMGLNNIEKRIEKLEGTLEIDSKSGRGSTFILDIPT